LTKIAVITATYNRASLIRNLWSSLNSQENSDFVWYIIDDGSVDDTKKVVSEFRENSSFEIKYFYQKNSGKHAAISFAFSVVAEPWLVVIDSDDYLVPDAIQKMWNKIAQSDQNIMSLAFHRSYHNGDIVGDAFRKEIGTYVERVNDGIAGDKVCLHRTKACKGFKNPIFPGEKFLAEMPSFIWFSKNNLTQFINEPVLVTNYLDAGLTKNSIRFRQKNICSTLYTYSCMSKYHSGLSLKYRIRAAINWWRFYFSNPILKNTNFHLFLIYFMPIGLFMRFYDYLKVRS